MAKIVAVRVRDEPHWAPASEFRAQPGLIELHKEGSEVHVRFLKPHPLAMRLGDGEEYHVGFQDWNYVTYGSDKPAVKK